MVGRMRRRGRKRQWRRTEKRLPGAVAVEKDTNSARYAKPEKARAKK